MCKKACGIDGISAKTIKACKANISGPLSKLINYSIATSKFPDRLNEAQVIPVYKKKDPLDNRTTDQSVSSLSYLNFTKGH